MSILSAGAAEATEYLPAARDTREEVGRQALLLLAEPLLWELLDAMTGFCLVLNARRQIVFINKAFEGFLRVSGAELALGQRPGELADCVNARRTAGGCGTTAACRQCGVGRALEVGGAGRIFSGECRLRTKNPGEDLELAVRATPFSVKGERFILMAASDLSAVKRRQALERIFFHDVLNTAGGIHGWAKMMTVSDPLLAVREYAPIVCSSAEKIVEEIRAQQDLVAAERGELAVKSAPIPAGTFVEELISLYRGHPCAEGRSLLAGPEHQDFVLYSDRVLLARVLGNLIKNALEATPAAGAARVWSRREEDRAVFRVHNSTTMPPALQAQVFQRSFSTKGQGRGLGTYSIRLLTERYLSGTAAFSSTPEEGTTFEVSCPIGAPD